MMSKKRKYHFLANDWYGDNWEDGPEFDSCWDEEYPEYICEDAAEYYHEICDGWEDKWPVTFKIYTVEGKLLGKFKAIKESVPEFHAIKI